MAKRVGLRPEVVLGAALDLADREGLAAVSLASVAAAVGVRSPSLYSHFDGLEALHRAIGLHAAGALAGALNAARQGRRGAEALESVAWEYLRFVRAHPGWYEAIQRMAPKEQDTQLYRALAEIVMPIVACLVEMGVPPGEMIHQTRVVRGALHGFASLEQSSGFGRPVDFDESYARLVGLLVSGVAGGAR